MGDTVVISRSVESVTSDAETILFVDEGSIIERAATTSSVSTMTIEDENDDRLYTPDRPEAPFIQEKWRKGAMKRRSLPVLLAYNCQK